MSRKEGPPPSAIAVQLNRNLSTADLPGLLSICRSNFHEFDNVNRVTALHRLARLGPGPGADVQQRLLEELNEQVPDLKVQQLANTLWSLGRLLASWPPILDGIALRGVRDIEDFGAQECANFFWSCGKMLWKNTPLLEALSLHAERIAPQLLPQHLGNIAWGLAKMNNVNQPLIDTIAAKAVQTIPESDQQEISNLVWGFAKMLAKNTPLMDVVAQCSVANKKFNAQGLANLAWSCATMQFRPEALLEGIGEESLRILSTFTEQNLANMA